MTCDERRNLMPLYVADAMDAAEREALRRHLSGGCAACAGSLAEAEATFAAVPLGLDSVAPSPELFTRLMDRIDRAGRPTAVARSPWAWRVLSPVAAAAVAASVTFAVLAVRRPAQEARLTRAADERSALLRTVVAEREHTVEQLRQRLGEQQLLVDSLQRPTTAVVSLAGVGQKDAAAKLVWDAAGGRSILLATHLTPPRPGHTYELWYIPADQKPRRAGKFTVGPDGTTTMTAAIPGDMGPLTVAAVSDEPVGVADAAPPGAIQLAGKP